jgi:osmotically-inducible protein OsmY
LGDNILNWPLQIKTQGGEVYLSGNVTAQQKEAILTWVKAVDGVSKVNDLLETSNTPDVGS